MFGSNLPHRASTASRMDGWTGAPSLSSQLAEARVVGGEVQSSRSESCVAFGNGRESRVHSQPSAPTRRSAPHTAPPWPWLSPRWTGAAGRKPAADGLHRLERWATIAMIQKKTSRNGVYSRKQPNPFTVEKSCTCDLARFFPLGVGMPESSFLGASDIDEKKPSTGEATGNAWTPAAECLAS